MTEIKTIAIIGDGRMGQSIFRHLYNYDYKLIWVNLSSYNEESEKLTRKLNRFLSKNLISQEDFDKKTNSVIITNSLENIHECDLIIETVNEDIDIKNSLFYELETKANSNAIIVSNSSSILPGRFDINEKIKPNFCGMHFFYPVETTKLLEIIPSSATSDKTLETVISFAETIEKKVFAQNDDTAFAINRFFLEIQSGFYNYCIENKLDFQLADQAVKNKLFPLGIFETLDIIGFRILEYSIENYIKMQSQSSHIIPIFDFIKTKMNEGKKGLIDNEGFLKYPLGITNVDSNSETKISDFLKSLISQTADNYIHSGFFRNKMDIEFVISEYTNSEYIL
ncbi:MAG: 3-hydroxyacyl-CoA dehydrogenase family protein [Bacteroidetes bacterium]|nr:3-hydroxyacyl-CoA dehydrogenase family protein [Bacteroidota bacterium]